MAVPVAGQIIRASDVITYEDAKPRCHAYDSVGNVCVSVGAVIKLVLYDSEVYDSTGTMHGASTSRLVAPIDGLYRFSALTRFTSDTYTVGLSNVRRNAAGASGGGTSLANLFFHATGGSTGPAPFHSFNVLLTATDYLEVFVSQTSTGGNKTTVAGAWGTFATLEYIASS